MYEFPDAINPVALKGFSAQKAEDGYIFKNEYGFEYRFSENSVALR